jgi:hypothetical protein
VLYCRHIQKATKSAVASNTEDGFIMSNPRQCSEGSSATPYVVGAIPGAAAP